MTKCLALLCLVLCTEVTTARLCAIQCVVSHQSTDLDEVCQTQCLLQLDILINSLTRNKYIGPELLLQRFQLLDSLLQALRITCHTNVLPHDVTQLTMDGINRFLTLDAHQLIDAILDSLLSLSKLRQLCAETRHLNLVGQIVLDRVGQYEVTVCQTLHQRRCTQAVRTVIVEVSLTDSEQTRNRSHQLIINPQTTHRVVQCRIDHHWCLIRIIVGNLLVHIEQVTIFLLNYLFTQAVDGVREIQEDSQTCVVHTVTSVATLLSGT